jgi:hypothetical protein
MDYLGPLERQPGADGKPLAYVLVLLDAASRFLMLHPCLHACAESPVPGLQRWSCRFGYPMVLRSDNARHFDAVDVSSWADSHHVSFVRGVPHHPSGQGIVESRMPDIITLLKSLPEGSEPWPLHLDLAESILTFEGSGSPSARSARTGLHVASCLGSGIVAS